MLSYRWMKVLTVLIPTIIIGGFEFIRHAFLLHIFSMEAGNWVITMMTLILSFLYAEWMFGSIERKNKQLSAEKTRHAVYEERERMARELHDNIAQILFFLNVQLKQGRLEHAREAVSELDHHVRQAIFNLRSSPTDGVSLQDRIDKWLDEWSRISGIKVAIHMQVPEGSFSISEEVQLFAIIQEAFTNIRKHSKAEKSELELSVSEERWALHIRDNGIGFHTSTTMNENQQHHYGVSMMMRRAQELNASFTIESLEEGGTEMKVICLKKGG